MTFSIGAGFIAWKPSGNSSSGASGARVQPAPEMQPVGIEHGHSSVLSRISTDLSKNATKLHQLDLERVSERTEAKRQLQVTLGDLKNRVARRAAARARSTSVNGAVELAYIAS